MTTRVPLISTFTMTRSFRNDSNKDSRDINNEINNNGNNKSNSNYNMTKSTAIEKRKKKVSSLKESFYPRCELVNYLIAHPIVCFTRCPEAVFKVRPVSIEADVFTNTTLSTFTYCIVFRA